MRRQAVLLMVAATGVEWLMGAILQAAEPAAAPPPVIRELYVPFDDLNVLLENQPHRVLLSRQEYEELLIKAKLRPEPTPPVRAVVLSAEYQVTVEQERAGIVGHLAVELIDDHLQMLDLDLAGVGLRSVRLDGKDAAVGRSNDGRVVLFVERKGVHDVELNLVAPLTTTAAQQVLDFRIPTPGATRVHLTVPGDVEIKSGMKVISRTVDAAASQTLFELLPAHDKTTIVMTLNSRLLRKERVVVARSVVVDEVTQHYERLHATFSLAVLHKALDSFRLAVPAGFEVTQVQSSLLARWSVVSGEQDGRVLDIRLREQTTQTVVLSVAAIRTLPPAEAWAFPSFKVLDVSGEVAVIGLLLEDGMKAHGIQSDGLIPIDTGVLNQALPGSVFQAEPGAPQIRPIVAYYAPQSSFRLGAAFRKPPTRLLATTNLLLTLAERNQQLRGGFTLLSETEKLFSVDFTVPDGWLVTEVTGPDGKNLNTERFPGRIHVQLPQGVPPRQPCQVYFQASSSPAGWLTGWASTTVSFPAFRIVGAARETGAVAVAVQDDLAVRPDSLDQLTPLDEKEKEAYGLAGAATSLAYRFDGPSYQARIVAERVVPRLTAQTYSFLVIGPDVLTAHYEIVYEVEQARVQRLGLILPVTAPETLSIQGLDGVVLKEYTGRTMENVRQWSILLEEARRGTIRVAVDFQQPTTAREVTDLEMPVVKAEGVAHQAGYVSVEGNAELDVKVRSKLRKVDIGELVNARYQPGKRLLGVYSFVGDAPELAVRIARHPGHDLPSILIERAELITVLAAEGLSQNAARVLLRAKDPYIEVRLPAAATLWSAELDGVAAKPQREDQRLLLHLPAGSEAQLHDLRFVYEMPVQGVWFHDDVEVQAPALLLRRSAQAAGTPVPVAALTWHVYVPSGYRVTDAGGTVTTHQIEPVQPAISVLGRALYTLAGGINPFYASLGLARARELGGVSTAPLASPGPILDADADGIVDQLDDDHLARQVTRDSRMRVPAAAGRPARGEEPQEKAEKPADAAAKGDQPEGGLSAGTSISPPTAPASGKPTSKGLWVLEGVRSLKIDLEESGERFTFRNLGADPRVSLALLDEHRSSALAWALACAVGLWGLRLAKRPVRSRLKFILAVILAASLISLVSGSSLLTELLNPSVLVAAALIPCYLLIGLVRWLVHRVELTPSPKAPVAAASSSAATAAVFLAVLALWPHPPARAQEPPKSGLPMVVEITEPHKPVDVPPDVILLPYDPASGKGVKDVQQMLVPYEKYLELWKRAHPDERMTTTVPPAAYGLSNVALRATLQGDDSLLIDGQAEIDVYAEGVIHVPLPLENGVLVKADLDGHLAKLGVVSVAPPPGSQPAAQPAPEQLPAVQKGAAGAAGGRPAGGLLVLSVSGKGRHHLTVAAQMQLHRSGGWRSVEGRLLAATAGTLTLVVPEASTEVRLAGVADRLSYLTDQAHQPIEAALAADGRLSIRWRPKVNEGVVDQSLTAHSTALLDVQEDGLRLVWRVGLEFRRGERSSFRVSLPSDYLVTQVAGGNVRGWEVSSPDGSRYLEVTLLKPAKDGERFDVHLWRRGEVGGRELSAFEVPAVTVPDAALHHGSLVIRRSPLLDIRTESIHGASRTDLPPASGSPDDLALVAESPLGIRPFAAYRFVALPFSIRLNAAPVPGRITARTQAILRVGERERSLEARVILDVQDRALHHVAILVPADLDLNQISAPGVFEWAVTAQQEHKLLSIALTEGQTGSVPVVIAGRLGEVGPAMQVPLPRLEVCGVPQQEGDLVVQTDPAFKVDTVGLQQCEPVLLNRVMDWLQPQQRELARVALHYRSPGYSGQIRLVPLSPNVHCYTVSNARITDRAIEETVLLDFTIRQAGIREVSFLLPEDMKDARVNVPQLRQKTIEAVSEDALDGSRASSRPAASQPQGAPQEHRGLIRVRLQLQDRVMGQLRVLVENDRLLTAQTHRVPIPLVETGQTDQRYVLLESAGRDEVVVEIQRGLTPLDRQQKERQTLAGILGTQIPDAYVVDAGAKDPALAFKTKDRALVETAGARIGLAQGWMSVDASGTYRAVQAYRVDNSTEQFLEIQLPAGAELWTASVAGEPAKPTRLPDPARSDHLLIPLFKTAAGDLDYEVVLKYGGRLSSLGGAGAVALPLIRAVNISAEVSQVRLFLPEQYKWFDFGGTMTQVQDDAELAAGFVSYQTKRAERLNQAMRGASGFAQVRAVENLKIVQSELEGYQRSMSSLGDNAQLQAEWASNSLVIAGVNKQSEEVVQKLGRLDAADNRDNLNRYYFDQGRIRSHDVVQKGAANFVFDLELPASRPAVTDRGFNGDWFASKGLANQVADLDAGKRLGFLQGLGREKGQAGDLQAQPQAPAVVQGPPPPQVAAQPTADGKITKSTADQPAKGRRFRGGGEVGSTGQQALGQYQAALQEQAARQRHSEGEDRQRLPDARGFGGFGGFGGSGVMLPRPATTQPSLPSGLTSLDVDLPQVGTLYRFTSPRGEATITVRTFSRSSIATLKRLGLALLVVVVVGLTLKLAARLANSRVSRSTFRRVAIVVGAISMVSGVFPLAGLALLILGIASWLGRRKDRTPTAPLPT
ncbi:MAG TPA: hypothetical protein PKY77_01480 [Phycisphaerae bacterium]|nr:hypothetical protein [Phycisphaerae bacterium]HRY68044.1 hypothetical protein [Phycisphaerae bacterium]HSA28676.1 hypothetical protein [Phycisphaerae bacterium]